MKFKLYKAGNIDEGVKHAIEESLAIWEDQIDIHQRLIRICNTNIATLIQKRNEIRLLDDMIRQIKKEPNAEKKLKKLKGVMKKVSSQISDQIPNEIKSLIKDLKTASRRERIDALIKKVHTLEKQWI